ncbi:leucine-rich repeat protein [Treponema pedis]|uniref:Leucine-rich repeat protein n=1 Tax=Treponema pedis TaxID=409322 RepID=A0A7S7AX47_9SPIR|nr:leucine-rich repeat protein [Treponema pedis]QOW61597.1 leucine-rich repeat protein [Treponema pedis]
MKTTKNYLLTVFIAVLISCIFTACSNTASGKSTRSTGDESPSPVAGTYVKVPYSGLDAYLENLSGTGPHYIEVTGPIPKEYFKGTPPNPDNQGNPDNQKDQPKPNPGALGQTLKKHSDKKVALKIETYPEGLTDMDFCFAGCTSLTTAPNIPEGVTHMEGCFSDCTGLTTAPNIPGSVTNMSRCFEGCTSLQTVTLKCNYKEEAEQEKPFASVFTGCWGLLEGGIKVPHGQLDAYKKGAEKMGTTPEKFAAITN